MVDTESRKPVSLDDTRKAFEAEDGLFIAVTPEEIEATVPQASRDLRVSQFVPEQVIDPQFFDRPYYLGPANQSETDYFALARALEKTRRIGIANWVMRKHSYVGALLARDGYLMIIALRHAEEVIPISQLEPPEGRSLMPKERDMARALIGALSGKFEPESYSDAYEERIRELIAAKQAGKKIKPKRVQRRQPEESLEASLRASLARVSTNRSK